MTRPTLLLTAALLWPLTALAPKQCRLRRTPIRRNGSISSPRTCPTPTYPEGVWSVDDGVLTATEDQCIWTKKEYENFILDLEFKNADGHQQRRDRLLQRHEELDSQLGRDPDRRRLRREVGEAPEDLAVRRHLRPPGRQQERGQEARRVEPHDDHLQGPDDLRGAQRRARSTRWTCSKWTSAKKNPDGSEIPPWLSKPKAELATKGHIGLQGKHAGAPIYFRNLKIKPLEVQ